MHSLFPSEENQEPPLCRPFHQRIGRSLLELAIFSFFFLFDMVAHNTNIFWFLTNVDRSLDSTLRFRKLGFQRMCAALKLFQKRLVPRKRSLRTRTETKRAVAEITHRPHPPIPTPPKNLLALSFHQIHFSYLRQSSGEL